MGFTGRDALIPASPRSSQNSDVMRSGLDVMRRGFAVARKPLPSGCMYAKVVGIGGALTAPAGAIEMVGICGNWTPVAFTRKLLLTIISWCGMLGIGGAPTAPSCAIGLAGIGGNWTPAAFSGKLLLTVISWCGMLGGQKRAATRNVTSQSKCVGCRRMEVAPFKLAQMVSMPVATSKKFA